VRPPSQSTHRPTQEAGQLLPISVTLPAPAWLHETPFVDVAEGIYRDTLVTESCAEYRLRLRGNYRDKDMPRYDLNITIFDTIQYIVPSLQSEQLMHVCMSHHLYIIHVLMISIKQTMKVYKSKQIRTYEKSVVS